MVPAMVAPYIDLHQSGINFLKGATSMPGTVNWIATYEDPDSAATPKAVLYNSKGDIAMSRVIQCQPPVACPFPMEDLAFDTYKAALESGDDRYYYNENQSVINAPNSISQATPIELSEETPKADIEIIVEVIET